MADQEKTCFVIAPIGDNDTDTRKRSDQILEHIIRPAIEPLGYRAVRADEINEPGMITTQIINHVLEDDLVIADLTERNPNVFYELAVRHAVRKPVILMIEHGESIPFDVASARTIYLDHHDLDSVGEAKNQITEQAKSLGESSEDVENPISTSLDLQRLRQSDNPEQISLADIVSLLTNIRSNLSTLDDRLMIRDERFGPTSRSDRSMRMDHELIHIMHRLHNSQSELLPEVEELQTLLRSVHATLQTSRRPRILDSEITRQHRHRQPEQNPN